MLGPIYGPFLPASGPPTRRYAPGSPPPSPGTSSSPTRTPSSAASSPARSANSGPPGPDQVTIRTHETPSARPPRVPSKTLSATGRRRSQPWLTPGLKIIRELVAAQLPERLRSGYAGQRGDDGPHRGKPPRRDRLLRGRERVHDPESRRRGASAISEAEAMSLELLSKARIDCRHQRRGRRCPYRRPGRKVTPRCPVTMTWSAPTPMRQTR
jgi:hypothetical protein